MLTSCASAGSYVWFSEVPQAERAGDATEYVIGPYDAISIRTYEQENLSGTFKVRRDGRIALPLVGELVVASKHPAQVAREIEVKLKEFIVNPHVTVNVEQSQPITVSAVGELSHLGAMNLEPPARLIDALALAGGPTKLGDKSRIFVLRQFPAPQRIRFLYEGILRNDGGCADFPLRSGDVIVVE